MDDDVIKVLLIDDDEDDYLLTRELLSEVGIGRYALDWASSYEEGLKVAGLGKHDVCLVDYRLGERTGVQLIREARQPRISTPMILLTGQGNREIDLEAMEAGATDYLVKNETPAALMERTIRYALELNSERSRTEETLGAYAQKQAAVAEIGRLALTGGELKQLSAEVAALVARTLAVDYCKVLELLPDGDSLEMTAGVGWKTDYPVGLATVSAAVDSQAGFTLLSDVPVIVEDLRTETRFTVTPLLREHGVISGMSVVIPGREQPYGVLGAHTRSLRTFTDDDVNFLRVVANVLAEAIHRKRTEDELKQSESRFRRVVESNVIGIFSSDASGEIAEANDAFLKMSGYTREELAAGRIRWTEMTPPEYRKLDEKALAELAACGVCETYEKEYIRKDGSRISVLLSCATFEGGKHSGVGFVLDNSDRKKAEESLKQSQTWLDAIFDASRDGIVVEENDHIVYANNALANLYGYGSPEEVVGKHVSQFRVGDDDQRLLDFAHQRVAGEDAPAMYEFKGVRKDSRLFDVEVSVSSFQSGGKTFIVSTLRDSTERKQAERERQESQKRLRDLIDGVGPSMFVGLMTPEGILIECNRPALAAGGLRPEDVLGKPFVDTNWWAHSAAARQQLREAIARAALGESSRYDVQTQGAENKLIDVDFSLQPVRDETGEVVFLVPSASVITERKLAEDALRTSLAEFRTLAEAMPQMVWITRSDGWNIYFSQQWMDYTGLTLEQSLGHGWNKPFHPDDQQRAWDAWQQATAICGTYSIESRLRRADGVYRWWLVRGVPLQGTDGNIVKWFGTCTDIHDLKLAELEVLRANESLRRSEERYRELVENAIDIIYTLDRDGNYTSVNKAAEKILGYSREETLARNIVQSVSPRFREQARRLHAAQLGGKDISAREVEVIARDGRCVTLEVNTRTINENGLAVGVQGIARDITERKRMELERVSLVSELESERARLADIFTHAPAFIASLRGPEHIFELANTRFYSLIGGPRDIIGMRARDAFPEVEGQAFFELLDNVYATGIPFVGNEMPVEFANGTGGPRELKYINFVYQPLTGVNGKVSGIICHGVDVTEQVLARHNLQQTENQLRQSQKLESVGHLAGGIAHDFNNLLTVIMGYCEISLTRLERVDPVAQHIQEILKAATRAASLTCQLLAFSRKQVLQPKILDLNSVILNVEKMLGRLVGEDMELRTSPGVGLGLVKADPGQIEQVILNLVVNSRDAMPTGGKITIETANIYLDDAYASRHVAVQPGWYAMLAVTDGGHGMDEETQKLIFEPFFTTKEQGKGTGLGLSTVYGIVKQSGGSIWVYSEVGVGTTFKIYLPLVNEQETEVDARAARLESGAGAETILLAEDEEMVRNLARQSLEMQGYTVLDAANGGDALLLCQQHQGPIHLLLTDVVMPKMGGRELAERLVKLRPDMRILYMSGYPDQGIVNHGILDENIAFIGKPFTPDDLALKVANLLREDPAPVRSLETRSLPSSETLYGELSREIH